MVAFDPKLNETLLSYLHLTDKINVRNVLLFTEDRMLQEILFK